MPQQPRASGETYSVPASMYPGSPSQMRRNAFSTAGFLKNFAPAYGNGWRRE